MFKISASGLFRDLVSSRLGLQWLQAFGTVFIGLRCRLSGSLGLDVLGFRIPGPDLVFGLVELGVAYSRVEVSGLLTCRARGFSKAWHKKALGLGFQVAQGSGCGPA